MTIENNFQTITQKAERIVGGINVIQQIDGFEEYVNGISNNAQLDLRSYEESYAQTLNFIEASKKGSESLKQQIVQILSAIPQSGSKEQKETINKMAEKQISELIKSHQEKIVRLYQRNMEYVLSVKNEKRKKEQEDRSLASSLSASERDSEEKAKSISDIGSSYVVLPGDNSTFSTVG